MAFKDLAGDTNIDLPYAGKTYSIVPVSGDLGPRVQALFDVMRALALAEANGQTPDDPTSDQTVLLDDLKERDLFVEVLGPVYDEMIADRVPWEVLKRAAITVMTDACVDRESAEAWWNGEGKAPNRETRRAVARKGTAPSARPVSTAGTTKTPPKKSPSRGRGSSRTGR